MLFGFKDRNGQLICFCLVHGFIGVLEHNFLSTLTSYKKIKIRQNGSFTMPAL